MVQRAVQVQLPVSPQAALAGALKLPNCSPQGVGKRDLGIEYGLHKLLPVVSAAEGVKRVYVTVGNGMAAFARMAWSHLVPFATLTTWPVAGPARALEGQLQHIHAPPTLPIVTTLATPACLLAGRAGSLVKVGLLDQQPVEAGDLRQQAVQGSGMRSGTWSKPVQSGTAAARMLRHLPPHASLHAEGLAWSPPNITKSTLPPSCSAFRTLVLSCRAGRSSRVAAWSGHASGQRALQLL